MICVKIHDSYRKVVAFCDSELVGNYFEEGKKQLDVRESFFKENEIEFAEAVSIMQNESADYATFNIVGENSVKAAFEAGIINEENVSFVAGVPFALVLV